jgi:uncharacterized damage-inducible protein DinB
MNRKEALLTLAGASLLTPLSSSEARPAPTAPGTFVRDFLLRWQNALAYSLKVLDKMPEEQFGYAPTPDQMSFGKQFAHAGHWNTYFIGLLTGQPPLPEPTSLSKALLTDYYTTCHTHCTGIIGQLTEQQLDQTGYRNQAYWKQHSGRDLLLRAFMHTAHHRAQALVYLRLKGIEPPFFEF